MNRITLIVLICLAIVFDALAKDTGEESNIEHVRISKFLKTPAKGFSRPVNVLVIAYLPTPDGKNLDSEVTGIKTSLDEMKKKIFRMNTESKFMLEEGSKYKGYCNEKANPFLGYKIVDYIYVYENFKRGKQVPWNKECYRPDYHDVLKKVDAEKYVNEKGVTEIWLWGWHHGNIEPAESNMSSPAGVDISNSERYLDDLPVYKHTYVMYNYNMGRESTQAVHNHGHQIEASLMYANAKTDTTMSLFLNDFVGWKGKFKEAPISRVGDTHHPPNTNKDYGYLCEDLVESDIMDWHPDGSGKKTKVNCHTWGNIPYQWPDNKPAKDKIEAHWYIFWMQNIPGKNNGIRYNGKVLSNWWEFINNWDFAVKNDLKLVR